MPTSASELCITCHQTMRPAMWDTDPTHNHPQNPPIHKPEQIEAIKQMKTLLGSDNRLVCLSCHKMHDAQPGKAILADTLRDSALCIRCHSEKKPMIGSEHDLRKSGPTERNTRDETIAESGFCGACHTFHSLTRKPLPAPGDPQGLCSTCHSPGQVAAKHVGTMFHPVNLPDKQMTCLTCHDAHDPKHSQFLRADREQVCADCHKTLAESLSKPHDFSGRNDVRNALGSSPSESGRCGFCHSMHQAKGPMMLAATNQPVKTMDDACGQCHRPEGIAREHAIAKLNHPSGPEAKAKDAAQVKLPLFAGSVACGSCHDVHGNQKQS
jgi:predicted CXXCH cytochrome family protein